VNKPFVATLVVTLSIWLSGCAGRGSYVVLLPNPDGSVGEILVSATAGRQLLTQAQSGVLLDASAPPFQVSPEQLKRDFGTAISALPPLPEHFFLYFLPGNSQLTPASGTLLTQILQRIKAQAHIDLSVIGHTDTSGNAAINDKLALDRANSIAEQLRQAGVPSATITVESHGKRNLLVQTPDQTAESRNRRVEITLR